MFSDFPNALGKIFQEIQNEIDKGDKNEFFRHCKSHFGHSPDVDIYEKDKKLFVAIDLPGFKKEDISLEIRNDELKIEASRKIKYDEDVKIHQQERANQRFDRTVKIPRNVDENNIIAKFDNGTLVISLSIAEDEAAKTIIIE